LEAIGKLLEQLGYAAPLLYAAAAYGLFHWLDENLSDAAKAALASTMKLKDYRKEQVASALVEVFDRIYTRPLLSWRAFTRSLLFTMVVSAIVVFERYYRNEIEIVDLGGLYYLLVVLSFNVVTDYFSLFVIRSSLIRSGTKAVTGLTLAAMSGAAIVLLANALRVFATLTFFGTSIGFSVAAAFGTTAYPRALIPGTLLTFFHWGIPYTLAAVIVFSWLPLFALGILTIRALTPSSWIVEKAQWALKEGDKHPLKAIGYVAAVAVFAVTVGLRLIFTA
jgi:hypothetical protein